MTRWAFTPAAASFSRSCSSSSAVENPAAVPAPCDVPAGIREQGFRGKPRLVLEEDLVEPGIVGTFRNRRLHGASPAARHPWAVHLANYTPTGGIRETPNPSFPNSSLGTHSAKLPFRVRCIVSPAAQAMQLYSLVAGLVTRYEEARSPGNVASIRSTIGSRCPWPSATMFPRSCAPARAGRQGPAERR